VKILALETATEACSAALLLNGELIERFRLAPREHNRLILPMVEEILAEAGLALTSLDALAFGRGPGSFTGVRIATGVVQGLAFGAGLPVAPVSTLAALALEALDEAAEDHAFPCIDARMNEVYWGVYRRDGEGLVEAVDEEAVTPAASVTVPEAARGVGIGSGWGPYRRELCERLGENRIAAVLEHRFPRAGRIARLGARLCRLGGCVAAEHAQPVYLRDRVAKKPGGVW
jgi:tRNA threonylcarbamoyladenosine biosynthesis protein TsaB